MSTIYFTQAGDLALQSAGLAGLTNLKCDLCSAVPAPPDRGAVLADFTLASYTGYAQAAVTLTGGFVSSQGQVYALSGALRFVGPSSGAGVNCPGFLLQDGTSHTVWAWGTFDTPLPEQASTDVIEFVLRLALVDAPVLELIAP